MTTNVLICDDSSLARKLLARALPEDWAVKVSFAANGEEALTAIRDGLGDVLFLDLNMPVMDGYQTLEQIQQQELQSMVIVVSGDVQPEAHKRVTALGAVDFIKKPTSTEVLLDLLERYGLYDRVQTLAENAEVQVKKATAIQSSDSEETSTFDYIQEIVNVAMGQAADLLARLLNVFVKLPIPNVNLLEVGELQMALAQTQSSDQFSAVSQGFVGAGISGEALLLFNDSDFQEIAKLFNYTAEMDRSIELEMLMELASILIGACTSGIAKQMDISFSQGHPVILGQHIRVSELLKPESSISRQILTIELTYEIEHYGIQCDLLLLFTEDSLEALNQRLSYCV
jgi:chemotaxis protein CheY-P-specific phosphatase CheC